jgi:hypothetical protein
MGDCVEKEDAFKAAVLEEREACRNLLGTTTLLFLQDGERYALVPRVWLSHWRRWIASSPWKEQGGLKAARAAVSGGVPASGTINGSGIAGLTEALRDHTTSVDGKLRLLQHVPELKAHRDKWCQVLHLTASCNGRRAVATPLCRLDVQTRCGGDHVDCCGSTAKAVLCNIEVFF